MNKQRLIDKAYEVCNTLMDEPVKQYNSSEKDLWLGFVQDAKDGVSSTFTALVSGTSMTEQDYMDIVLAKDIILSDFRIKCINARNKHKEEINKLSTLREFGDYKSKVKDDFWPETPEE